MHACPEKHLKITKLHNQRYMEDELPLKKKKCEKPTNTCNPKEKVLGCLTEIVL